jgi:holo-[acyl-carrier protein] synthase
MPGLETLPIKPGIEATALGIDIVDTRRLRGMVRRQGDALLEYVFTDAERATGQGDQGLRWEYLAGCFAAKEATRKVLASRGHVSGWTEVEIHEDAYGRPLLQVHGRAGAATRACGFRSLLVSIAHSRTVAIAFVVAIAGE